MNPLASLLRAELLRYDPLILRDIRPPRNPDPWVFGVPYERGEPQGQGWLFPACPVHQVGWRGPEECWCCAAQVPPC